MSNCQWTSLYGLFLDHKSILFNPNLGRLYRGSFWGGEISSPPPPPPTFASPPTRLKLDRIMLKTFHYILQKELFTLVESNSNNTLSIEEYLKKIKPNLKHITNNL